MPLISKSLARDAANYLSQKDTTLANVIATQPLCDIEPHTDYYRSLVRSIIGQQLSVKAAASIFNRFLLLFDSSFPSPEQIIGKTFEELRSVGLSTAKANYVYDLALHVVDKKLVFDNFDQYSNDEIIKALTEVKGIGEWTAHMFLMFCMGKSDILPVGDLGIRTGIRNLYGLDSIPTPLEVTELAAKNRWHPYESIASWYIWRSLDNAPE